MAAALPIRLSPWTLFGSQASRNCACVSGFPHRYTADRQLTHLLDLLAILPPHIEYYRWPHTKLAVQRDTLVAARNYRCQPRSKNTLTRRNTTSVCLSFFFLAIAMCVNSPLPWLLCPIRLSLPDVPANVIQTVVSSTNTPASGHPRVQDRVSKEREKPVNNGHVS